MRKNKQKKPVSPIYALGLAWLIYSVFFHLSGFWSIAKCAVLAWAVYMLVKSIVKKDKQEPQEEEKPSEKQSKQAAQQPQEKPKPAPQPEPEPKQEEFRSTGNPELDAVIRQGRQSVKRIQEINDDIPDFKISAQLKQIEILTASVIDQVEKKEEKLKQVRQFMNYYLPTTIKLLEQYVQLQNVGLKGENISTAMQQIEQMLDKVIVAFQKQLDSMFERDVVDITADIQVMEQMMAAQGLTKEKDF